MSLGLLHISVDEDGTNVKIRGVNMESRGVLIAETRDFFAVKWSRGNHWVAIGEYAYHSPKITVYQKQEPGAAFPLRAKEVIEWETPRKTVPVSPKKFKR